MESLLSIVPAQFSPRASANRRGLHCAFLSVPIFTTIAVALLGCQHTNPSTLRPSHVDAIASEKFPSSRPSDATAFGGHWYKAFDEKVCWHTAQAACERMGGYLACIESNAEQAFIAKLADGRYLYLGAQDEDKEFEFVWVNGARWDFAAWLNGQPNDYGGNERYLATYDGGEWVDVADEGDGFWMPTGFICEWEP
jgi:hypothetical protein